MHFVQQTADAGVRLNAPTCTDVQLNITISCVYEIIINIIIISRLPETLNIFIHTWYIL